MGRCLIIANQTLGGVALDRAVRDCISRDRNQFYVAVPVTPVEHETPAWTGGFTTGHAALSPELTDEAVEENRRRQEAAHAKARRLAQDRLDQMIEKIRSAGGEAEGRLGAADPLEAAKEALEGRSYDEVIVSTLPSRLSRWLKMDLPNRITRLTDAPVTTIEAHAETEA